jgi:hypothetical protein
MTKPAPARATGMKRKRGDQDYPDLTPADREIKMRKHNQAKTRRLTNYCVLVFPTNSLNPVKKDFDRVRKIVRLTVSSDTALLTQKCCIGTNG